MIRSEGVTECTKNPKGASCRRKYLADKYEVSTKTIDRRAAAGILKKRMIGPRLVASTRTELRRDRGHPMSDNVTCFVAHQKARDAEMEKVFANRRASPDARDRRRPA
jgi:hypothetical protein